MPAGRPRFRRRLLLRALHVVGGVLRLAAHVLLVEAGGDEAANLTRGGPGSSTETISLYIYKLAFNDFQLAYGAAAAFLVLVGTLALINMMLLPIREQLLKERR